LDVTRVEPDMGHSARAPRAYLRAFLRRGPDGDVAKLSRWFQNRFPALPGLVPAARSEEATTLEARCPHFQRCFFPTAAALARALPARRPRRAGRGAHGGGRGHRHTHRGALGVRLRAPHRAAGRTRGPTRTALRAAARARRPATAGGPRADGRPGRGAAPPP